MRVRIISEFDINKKDMIKFAENNGFTKEDWADSIKEIQEGIVTNELHNELCFTKNETVIVEEVKQQLNQPKTEK